jgi:MFS family permease
LKSLTAAREVSTGADTVARRRHLSPRFAFYLLASIAVSFLAGSSAPTPLYAVYQGKWGFSPITTTIVFGVYALAVLTALLTVGSLSDHVGRRPVLITAIAVQAATMVLFATADGVPALMLARVIQGLSTGAALGAVGAGLLDLDRRRGTIANAVAPITGTATGALGSAVLVQLLPAPTRLVYLVLLGVFLGQGLGVWFMAESSAPEVPAVPTSAAAPTAGALASLRPQFGVPAIARRPLLVAAPAFVAVWSLTGLYGSLGPSVVRLIVGSNSIVFGGLALFVLAASGALTVLLLHNAAARMMMFRGLLALFAGLGLTLLALIQTSTAEFFIGTAIAGAGFGATFQGAIRSVIPLAAAHHRAELLSTVYVISYLAMGLPAVIAGFLVVHGGGVLTTAREYAVAVMVLVAMALAGVALSRPRPTSPTKATVSDGSEIALLAEAT